MKGSRKKFTTTIDEELLQKMKIQAIKENTSLSELIEKLFKDYMKNTKA